MRNLSTDSYSICTYSWSRQRKSPTICPMYMVLPYRCSDEGKKTLLSQDVLTGITKKGKPL